MKVELTNNGLSNSIVKTQIGDSASADAFGRLRTSEPNNVFDNQFTYDLAPLLFEQITALSGATITHDTTNRCALMTFTSTSANGKAYMQTYQWFRYQPSKSLFCFLSFNMIEGVTDVVKFAGLSDGNNGIEFQVEGATKRFVIYSDSANGDQTATQPNWNLDTLDGTGSSSNPSGINLDISKAQILVFDAQFLYAGRLRMGFDIGGTIVYAHEFLHANIITTPYVQTANLPLRVGMTTNSSVSSPITTTMRFICCSLEYEGGEDATLGYTFCAEGSATSSVGSDVHLLSIQPKTTFNSFANRSKIELVFFDIINIGNHPIIWKLCIGQALTSTSVADVNATYSAVQTITGTLSGSPAIIISRGYIQSANRGSVSLISSINEKYPFTLNANGSARALGRYTLLIEGITNTSDCRGVLNWTEIR